MNDIDINNLREMCKRGAVKQSGHAIKRSKQRLISIENMKLAVMNGEIISQNPKSKPYPQCKVLGKTADGGYIHIFCELRADLLLFKTAYFPDDRWEDDLKTKKKKR